MFLIGLYICILGGKKEKPNKYFLPQSPSLEDESLRMKFRKFGRSSEGGGGKEIDSADLFPSSIFMFSSFSTM